VHGKAGTDFVKNCLEQGMSLDDALGQLAVYKEEHNFKQNLESALSDTTIQKRIREIVANGS